jgi:hypothetical protein
MREILALATMVLCVVFAFEAAADEADGLARLPQVPVLTQTGHQPQ